MRKKPFFIFSCLGLILTLVCLGGLFFASGYWMVLRPQPGDVTRELFLGVVYQRDSRQQPRPLVVHVVRVQLNQEGIGVMVTPGDPDADLPYAAQTTSRFLRKHAVQVAINGDAFSPFHSRSLLDYYPRAGDPVDVTGYAVSDGIQYSLPSDSEPVLYFSSNNRARINVPVGNTRYAISGSLLLVSQGRAVNALENDIPQPRTAAGLDKNRRELILVVVDGRQPGYSEGVTPTELADIMVELGAYEAINLDGGGSSTLVVEGPNGRPRILNSPINHGIPGFERPVANHLGIFASPLPEN
jgi:hypothetical protein